VKLMAGSWGTLGVLTEVSLKVLPAPEAAAALVIGGLDAARAVEAMTAALVSPFDVTGAAHRDGETLVRIEGFAQSVAYRSDSLAEVLAAFGAVRVERDRDAVAALWRGVRDAAPFHGRPGAVWRISLRASAAAGFLAALEAAGLAPETIMDWGGGLLWLLLPEVGDAGAAVIRGEIAKRGGHATLVRATPGTRARIAPFQPEPAPLAAISAGIRARFDPRGILNPGLMG